MLKKDKDKDKLFSSSTGVDKNGKTLLHLAVSSWNNEEILNLLLKEKRVKDILNIRDDRHRTALGTTL
jgi:hypothetical protein